MKQQSFIVAEDTHSLKERSSKRLAKKRANDLDGKKWLQYSISVWNDIKKTPEEMKLRHPAMFPTLLVRRILEALTTKDQNKVLDPFVGAGSTLLAAQELGKEGWGFDISEEYINLAIRRIGQQTQLFENGNNIQHCICDDARNVLKYLTKDSIDICITSPPYWDILSEKRTADNKTIKNYDKDQGNLGMIHNYQRFLNELQNIFENVFIVLRSGSYCIINVMDLRKGSRFYPLHSDVADMMQRIGFIYDDIIIWDRRTDYNELRPLGYPSVFRINKVHEYLLIFLKPRKQPKSR